MKLNEWLDTWLNKYMKHTIKLRTYLRYDEIIKNHINPLLGNYELNDLKSSILQNFVSYKLEYGNLISHTSLADNSVIAIISVLKQALKQAVSLGIIDKEYSSLIKMPITTEKQITAFSRKEQHILESFCLNNSKSNYIGIIICLYTGIRLGELLALTWEDINFQHKMITINKTVYTIQKDNKNFAYIDKPKTKNSYRVIPIPNQLLPILKQRKKYQNHSLLFRPKKGISCKIDLTKKLSKVS